LVVCALFFRRCFSGWPYGHGFSPPEKNQAEDKNQKNSAYQKKKAARRRP
jgi:hypothetical protein